ncbi:hypothetical protein BCR39DRAFT_546875 [Naematelia encephala]|uniref:Chromatin assembly factor 1 subunit A-domain-containing protein n=1 Tax=Naematelia encephala TaxID=71784 RepID=A0A1Y2AP68_9TREE|nr:hypothetical protein BCR39DRAFT_546875 [Naematelia encephala]
MVTSDEVRDLSRPIEPMTENQNVENTAGIKRKVEQVDIVDFKPKVKIEATGSQEKKPKTQGRMPLVELKGRKLAIKQPALDRSKQFKLPLTRSHAWSSFIVDVITNPEKPKPSGIPEELWDVIVNHGIESTARTDAMLVKQLRKSLLSDITDDQARSIPDTWFSSLIPSLFDQVDYGYTPSSFAPFNITTKLPTSLQSKFWEAREADRWFTSEQVAILDERRKERERAREECLKLLDALDDVEKLELLTGEAKEIRVMKPDEPTDYQPLVEQRMSREGTANTTDSRRSASPTRKSKLTPEEEEARRLRKEEQEAKRAAKAEEKAAKDREEEKKRNVAAKQAQGFMGFFKPKPAERNPVNRENHAGPSTPIVREKKLQVSDFARTFKPIAMKPNVEWAEINRWVKPRRKSQSPEKDASRGISGKTLSGWGERGDPETATWSERDFLDDHLKKHRIKARAQRSSLPRGLKVGPLHGPVSELWAAYQQAEDPRKVLAQLKNRSKFPWKTLAFTEQIRPPYSGTFTKKSVTVGPRTPFAQDPTFDYSYDSGDEWQDDEGGDDVDEADVASATSDVEDDQTEGEFDDWLDDSEDAVYAPPPADLDDDMPLQLTNGMDQPRLNMKVVKKSREVPKRVVKVTPYWKGPVWESKLGEGTEGMEAYRIQLLNDSPCALDPFAFTSEDPPQSYKGVFSTAVIGTNLNVRCLLSTNVISPPAVDAALVSTDASASVTDLTPGGMIQAGKARVSGPKIAFPSSHLAELLGLIDGNTKIRTDLISQLKAHFDTVTSKAAIEAKIKEVATREGKAKDSRWKVKAEAWVSATSILSPPLVP